MKCAFTFSVQYFKESGKYYTETRTRLEVTNLTPDKYGGLPSMNEACDLIRKMNEEGNLPGLGSSKWDGPIYLNCEDGYPCLIMPRS